MISERQPGLYKRRDILRLALGAGLMGGGGIDAYFTVKKAKRLSREAQEQVRQAGILKPNPKALQESEEIRSEKPEQILKNRTPQEVWKAIKTQAQQDKYDTTIKDTLNKNGAYDQIPRGLIDIVAFFTGETMTGKSVKNLIKTKLAAVKANKNK